MITITKDSIQDTIEGLEHLANRGIQSVYIDMAIAGMRRLLASLEAEPVAYADPQAFRNFQAGAARREWMWRNPGEDLIPLFTVPPAMVSVPEKLPCDLENEWSLVDAANKNKSIPDEKVKGDDFELDGPLSCYQAGKIDGWNEYRAAMLQGADGNSTVIPDGLNIRAVAALREAVRNQWLKSDEFAEKIYWKNMHDIANEIVVAMLAAAPQQEFK